MCIIVVRKEGENVLNVIGTLDFCVHYIHPEEHSKISDVDIAESARGLGVGSCMIKFAIEYAKENGLRQVFVFPNQDNKRALALYRKMGFTVIIILLICLSFNRKYEYLS